MGNEGNEGRELAMRGLLVSVLPGDSGAWLRYVGDDTVASMQVHTAAAAALHRLITGTAAPRIRK